jgi:hypothetical protein
VTQLKLRRTHLAHNLRNAICVVQNEVDVEPSRSSLVQLVQILKNRFAKADEGISLIFRGGVQIKYISNQTSRFVGKVRSGRK